MSSMINMYAAMRLIGIFMDVTVLKPKGLPEVSCLGAI